ncbi:serine aminopeptidase domain-containing protein [Ottowia sp.]|uniref:alpha/beta hydrolase family protein n=1 Tax=Ottowia sp. TaxID=1898956 RepID=UPI003A85966A
MTDAVENEVLIESPDGGRVAAHVFEPPTGLSVTRQVVIAPAMGVAQSRYAAFASWLAVQGVRVLTFDYRGQGASLLLADSGKLRRVRATLDDWRADYEAATQYLHARAPDLPLTLIGHSLGAQLPGLFERTGHIGGLLSVASGSGYWRENAPALRARALLMWHGMVPLFTPLFGYFPGRRLGAVGDLPAGVIRQWRRWCLHPRYSGAEGDEALARYAAVRFPVLALSVTDDEMMTLRGTQSLLALYAGAPSRIERVAPADFGLPRIGHLGWFHPRHQDTLWLHARDALFNLHARVAAGAEPGIDSDGPSGAWATAS